MNFDYEYTSPDIPILSTTAVNKRRFFKQVPLLKVWASRGFNQVHVPLGKISRYGPLRCHFLHFEITVSGNTVPKIIPGSCSDDKRVKMAVKHRGHEIHYTVEPDDYPDFLIIRTFSLVPIWSWIFISHDQDP